MLPKKGVQPDLDFQMCHRQFCATVSPERPNEDINSRIRPQCELLFVPHFDWLGTINNEHISQPRLIVMQCCGGHRAVEVLPKETPLRDSHWTWCDVIDTFFGSPTAAATGSKKLLAPSGWWSLKWWYRQAWKKTDGTGIFKLFLPKCWA